MRRLTDPLTPGASARTRNAAPTAFAAAVVCMLMLVPGCVLQQRAPRLVATPYRPQNVFLWGASFPPQIRRVALLPTTCDPDVAELVYGRELLDPILQGELAKIHKFELAPVSAETLQARTGQVSVRCEEALPQDLFAWLGDACGCNAVLFCRLTVFRGYPPLAIGWRMRLVDVRTHSTIWASDELFDASQAAVQSGARHYQLGARQNYAPVPDEWVIENSPRQFGQYVTAQLLATLPGQ